jgi:uncharacterized protein YjgD (DUF1641 family)
MWAVDVDTIGIPSARLITNRSANRRSDEGMCAMTAEIPTSTDPLAAMLADPEIRESLAVIVANAPALAALASMSSALLQRGPELADNVNGLVEQLRNSDTDDPGDLRNAVTALSELAPLTPLLAERKDTIAGFLDSPILRPEIVDVVGNLGEAALEADRQTKGRQVDAGGVFSLVKQLKNPDVQETISFLLAFAKVFGARQRSS